MLQVGDGLEMYVVLAKGRTLQGLEGIRGMQELTTDDGERVFVVRRAQEGLGRQLVLWFVTNIMNFASNRTSLLLFILLHWRNTLDFDCS